MRYYVSKPDYFKLLNGGIRDKKDIVNVILNLITLCNTYAFENLEAKDKTEANVLLVVEKMCRCFIMEADSIHTFQIPFAIKRFDSFLSFYFEDEPIDSRMCAIVESWVSRFWDESFENVFDFWADIDGDDEEYDTRNGYYQDRFWRIYLELLQFESGYMRYDHDELRHDSEYHPVDHIDFFYSSNCTFKLGLRKAINADAFSKIMDVNEKKLYIENDELWK